MQLVSMCAGQLTVNEERWWRELQLAAPASAGGLRAEFVLGGAGWQPADRLSIGPSGRSNFNGLPMALRRDGAAMRKHAGRREHFR